MAAKMGAHKRIRSFPWVTVGGGFAVNSRKWERSLERRGEVEELAARFGQIETLRRKLARIRGESYKPASVPIFVIVPCDKSKIFDSPHMLAKLQLGMTLELKGGAVVVQAQAAYVSRLFKAGLAFAKCFGDTYRILSAKYGLLEGHRFIGNYDESFTNPGPGVVSTEELQEQARMIQYQLLILTADA
ncbi:DUF6884 domain-containing protein [Desulfovibrio sp. Huiquan2017]|uniref:DUF6884 domain-containing protein n=1 Tax=Desulfovibrio sp. Huiquan2017 TaxID=2816861 RepID=UPI001A934A99|nr:DUF6884 domain-containing protein [Desulfovibrio sp. Huiquan2017]